MSLFTYDVTTEIGQVRLLIEDWDVSQHTGPRSTWSCIFTDEELAYFLSEQGNVVRLAAAVALDSIASSQARLAMRRTMGDYTEDLSSLARELRAQAQTYRDQVADEPADAIAEVANDEFAARQIRMNRAKRESL